MSAGLLLILRLIFVDSDQFGEVMSAGEKTPVCFLVFILSSFKLHCIHICVFLSASREFFLAVARS